VDSRKSSSPLLISSLSPWMVSIDHVQILFPRSSEFGIVKQTPKEKPITHRIFSGVLACELTCVYRTTRYRISNRFARNSECGFRIIIRTYSYVTYSYVDELRSHVLLRKKRTTTRRAIGRFMEHSFLPLSIGAVHYGIGIPEGYLGRFFWSHNGYNTHTY
jgi:hypothetical protein